MQVHKKEKMERHMSLMESERTGILWQSAKVGQKTLLTFFALFLYTIENSPMDFSGESQTSTNTSECESEEVANCTKSRSFVEGLGLITRTFSLYTEIFRRPLFYNNRVILVLKCVSLLEKLRIF